MRNTLTRYVVWLIIYVLVNIDFAGKVFQVQHVQLPLLSHGGGHCKGVQLHPDLQQSWMEGNL